MLNKEQRQELVEFSVMAMVSQAVPGYDRKRNVSRYMDQDGNRCGIGCMLTEKQCVHYDTLGVSAHVIARDEVNGWDALDGDFLDKWQNCHDNAVKDSVGGFPDFVSSFRWRVDYFCKAWDLRFPEEYI